MDKIDTSPAALRALAGELWWNAPHGATPLATSVLRAIAAEKEAAVAAFDAASRDAHLEIVREKDATIDALRASLAAAEQERDAARWQPIETAPRDGTLIDLWAGERIANCAWNVPSKCWGERIGVGSGWKYWAVVLDPTHWMPLPAAPDQPEDPAHG